MDEYEFYEENDESIKKDSSINKRVEKNLDILDKISDYKPASHNIENDLLNDEFIPRDEGDPVSEMILEDDYEPLDEPVLEKKIRFLD